MRRNRRVLCSGVPNLGWWEEQPGAGNEGMHCGEMKIIIESTKS